MVRKQRWAAMWQSGRRQHESQRPLHNPPYPWVKSYAGSPVLRALRLSSKEPWTPLSEHTAPWFSKATGFHERTPFHTSLWWSHSRGVRVCLAETKGSGLNKLWKDRWKAARASLSTSTGTVTEMETIGLFAWRDVLAAPSRPQSTHWQRTQVYLTNYTAVT